MRCRGEAHEKYKVIPGIWVLYLTQPRNDKLAEGVRTPHSSIYLVYVIAIRNEDVSGAELDIRVRFPVPGTVGT